MGQLAPYWKRVAIAAAHKSELLRPAKVVTTLTISIGNLLVQAHEGLRAWPITWRFVSVTLVVYALTSAVEVAVNFIRTPGRLEEEMRLRLVAAKTEADSQIAARDERLRLLEDRAPRMAILGVQFSYSNGFNISVRIENPGERTSIDGWTLDVEREDGVVVEGVPGVTSARAFQEGSRSEIGVFIEFGERLPYPGNLHNARLRLGASDIRGHLLHATYQHRVLTDA